MALTPEISRLAKMLVDAEGISQEEAERRLRALSIELLVGPDSTSRAAQNAVLTAVAVGARSFIGGVGVRFETDAPLITDMPVRGASLREAALSLGAVDLNNAPSVRVALGNPESGGEVEAHAWWSGWAGGCSRTPVVNGDGDNPLAGVVAGAASIAHAFARCTKAHVPAVSEFNLWPCSDCEPPPFTATYLPAAIWLLGIGNLGQAILWSLSALPYPNPQALKLVLQDRDRISPENWGTSVLVERGAYGAYKTAAGENWCKAKGFDVRRIDRWLDEDQRVQAGDPLLAMCGFDKIEPRRKIDTCGFDVVIDAGLGRRHDDFDLFRLTIFDRDHPIAAHFPEASPVMADAPHDYEKLLGIDSCGAALFHGIAIAAPFVSAIAGAAAVARAIAISSGASVPRNEIRRLSWGEPKLAPSFRPSGRGLLRIVQGQ